MGPSFLGWRAKVFFGEKLLTSIVIFIKSSWCYYYYCEVDLETCLDQNFISFFLGLKVYAFLGAFWKRNNSFDL